MLMKSALAATQREKKVEQTLYHGNNPQVTRWALGRWLKQFSGIQLGRELAFSQTRKLYFSTLHSRETALRICNLKKHPWLVHECMHLSYTNIHGREHTSLPCCLNKRITLTILKKKIR